MAISPSISQGTINAVRNLAGGWGRDFIEMDPLTSQAVRDDMEEIFGRREVIAAPPKEEVDRNSRLIMAQKKYWEEEEARRKGQEDFYAQLEKARPVINTEDATDRIENNARKLAMSLLDTMVRGIELNMAIGYVKSMLAQDVGVDITSFPERRIVSLGKDIGTIPVVNILCNHFGLSKEESSALLDREVSRIYGQHELPKNDALTQSSAAPQQPQIGPLMGDPQPRKREPQDHSFPSNPFAGNSNVTKPVNTGDTSTYRPSPPPAPRGSGSREDIRNSLLEQISKNIMGG